MLEPSFILCFFQHCGMFDRAHSSQNNQQHNTMAPKICSHNTDHTENSLNSRPFLRLTDLLKEFFLFSDASSIAITSCLVQKYQCTYLPRRYLSRKLTPTEQKWSVQDLEGLATIWSVSRLSKYLLGRHFFIVTDHKGLTVLPSRNVLQSKRIHRWALLLS